MKSAIIPLKSFRIPEIIIVKFDEQQKKKEERVILNLSSSKSLMFSCYILIWVLKLFQTVTSASFIFSPLISMFPAIKNSFWLINSIIYQLCFPDTL